MRIVDLMKRDSEIKILIGRTEEERTEVYRILPYLEYAASIAL
jgi:hypothetical protein